jgi:hypothetical protein
MLIPIAVYATKVAPLAASNFDLPTKSKISV